MTKLPSSLTTVTRFSKLLAGILFIILLLTAFVAGMKYQGMANSTKPSPTPKLNIVCTMEAKLCPDGKTYVSRTGPKCEFSPCP